MKFFTPQLMERFGSSDPEIADQADAQWEQAGDRYDAYLTQIEPDLREAIRHVQDNFSLHDAVVGGRSANEPLGDRRDHRCGR